MVGRSERWVRGVLADARKADDAQPAPPATEDGAEPASPAAEDRRGNPGGNAASMPTAIPRPLNGTARQPQPAARQPAAARRRQPARGPAGTPLPLLVLTVAAVGTVAAVCAVVSWIHIRDLAVTAGMGSLSGWLPLGIDGLAVACTCSLIADRRQDKDAHPLAVAGLVLGIGGSLVANVLAVDPELVPLRAVRWGLAGYPPLALAVSAHMLFRMLGEGGDR